MDQKVLETLSDLNENTPIGQLMTKLKELSINGDGNEKYRQMVADNKNDDKEQPFLSVVTRTRGDRPEALREVMLCLEAQSDMDFELLIMGHIDDEDLKASVIKLIEEQSQMMQDRIRYIDVREGNRTTPLNYGFAMARGKYISILDDDDIVFDNWVENFKSGAKAFDGRIIRAYAFTQEWEIIKEGALKGGLRAVGAPLPTYCNEFELLNQLNSNECPTMGLAYPSYVFQKLNIMFDESLSTVEDWDFLMRAVFMCGIYDTKVPTSIYRLWVNTTNSYSEHDKNEWLGNRLRIQKKFLNYPVVLTDDSIKPLLLTLNEMGEFEEIVKGESAGCKQSIITSGQKIVLKPKLYVDLGEGFNEKSTFYGKLSLKNGHFRVVFNTGVIGNNIRAIRIDASENSFFVINSLKLSLVKKDGKSTEISRDMISHNGYETDFGIAYLRPDPQLVVLFKEPEKIDFIEFEADLVEADIQAIFNSITSDTSLLSKIKRRLKS